MKQNTNEYMFSENNKRKLKQTIKVEQNLNLYSF